MNNATEQPQRAETLKLTSWWFYLNFTLNKTFRHCALSEEIFGPRCSISLADVCPPSFGLRLNNRLGSCSLVTMATGKSGTKALWF